MAFLNGAMGETPRGGRDSLMPIDVPVNSIIPMQKLVLLETPLGP